jgi:hypothetical protein
MHGLWCLGEASRSVILGTKVDDIEVVSQTKLDCNIQHSDDGNYYCCYHVEIFNNTGTIYFILHSFLYIILVVLILAVSCDSRLVFGFIRLYCLICFDAARCKRRRVACAKLKEDALILS